MSNYSGDLSIPEGWNILNENKESYLIDVRTVEEFKFVGVPWLEEIGKSVIFLPLRLLNGNQYNPSFQTELLKALEGKDPSKVILLFICRSGGRSAEAAAIATELGFSHCYNLQEGFEGGLDKNHHRGSLEGWKAAGLPWRQG